MNKLILSDRDIKGYCLEIVRGLKRSAWEPDYIVGITRGGLVPAVMLSYYLEIPMYTLDVRLRDGNPDECESNLWMAEHAFGHDCSKMNILIVDDINDSGATIAWIKQDWQSGCLPNRTEWDNIWHNNVRFATLVNNLSSKEQVDYWGTEINKAENDVWVEFPWENFWMK